ncbi:MAG: family ATPase [Rhodospirillales bacterium]|nr:family ATPase [Rhodospirillales bacterium]
MSQLSNIPQGTALTTTSWQDTSNEFRLGDEVRNEGLDVLKKVWRRRWLVAGIAGAFIAAGVIAGQLMTPRYTAEARLLVGVPQPQVTKIEQVLKGLEPNSETVLTETYVVASRDVARRVAYRLALDKSPAFNPYLQEDSWKDYLNPSKLLKAIMPSDESELSDQTSQDVASADAKKEADQETLWQIIDARLLDRIEVTPLNRSFVIAIAAQAEEPDVAARIANTFADVYLERELVRKQRAGDKANEWLQNRIKEVQKSAEESGRAVELYRRENGLLQTKSDTVIAQQLAALNSELVAAENAKAQADSNLAQARGTLQNPSNVESLPAVLQSEIVRTLRGQQADLERQAAELSSSYTNKHPRIREIQAQINDINGKIKGEITKVVRALSHESSIAQDRYNRAASRMEKLKNEMGQANTQTVKLMELERESQANNTMLETLLLRSKETVSQQDIAVPTADIISRANIPFGPSFPPKALIVVICAMIGTGAGVLLALLLENLDQTFRTGDEVEEYIGLPPLDRTRPLQTRCACSRPD